jgi:hypothetical protein
MAGSRSNPDKIKEIASVQKADLAMTMVILFRNIPQHWS